MPNQEPVKATRKKAVKPKLGGGVKPAGAIELPSIRFNILNQDSRKQGRLKTYGGTIGFSGREEDTNREGYGFATVIAVDAVSDGNWLLQTAKSLTVAHQDALDAYNEGLPDNQHALTIQKMVVKITDDRGKFATKCLQLRQRAGTNIQVIAKVEVENMWLEE